MMGGGGVVCGQGGGGYGSVGVVQWREREEIKGPTHSSATRWVAANCVCVLGEGAGFKMSPEGGLLRESYGLLKVLCLTAIGYWHVVCCIFCVSRRWL